MLSQAIFVTKVRTPAGKAVARLLIESIQSFGGAMRDCEIWIFATDPEVESCREFASSRVRVFSLLVPEALKRYPFGDKVLACARAETQAPVGVQSLIWLDLECLVIQPPTLYHLGDQFDVALRPVHLRNVGLSASEPLDDFWKGIYSELGIADVARTVESFIDCQRLRAYYNSHVLSVNPGRQLFGRWLVHFERLLEDETFQGRACQDERHRVFLFQALFSALVASSVAEHRVRILPSSYNYPYNLHSRIPDGRRAAALNDLVSMTFEGRSIDPKVVMDIEIREPLRTWLETRVALA